MPTINFPTAPATGAEYSYNGKAWRYNGTGWALTLGKPYGREALTADRTYYVATTGSDSADGLTVGSSFLTIQKAVDTYASLDTSIYQVTIQVADGTYTNPVIVKAAVGANAVIIQGNLTTPANVHINVTGSCFANATPSLVVVVRDMKLTATSNGLYASRFGVILFGNIIFGACSSYCYASDGGSIEASSNYFVAGNTTYGFIALYQSTVSIRARTCTFLASITVASSLITALRGGIITVESSTITLGGYTVTGKRYSVDAMAMIHGTGNNINFIPGTVAGTVTNGSQYL